MSNSYQSKSKITKKFQKKDCICNICGQEGNLSIDHVPPQSCPPASRRLTSTLFCRMIGSKGFRPRIDQNGVTFQTICASCNNLLGSRYDNALGELAHRIESLIIQKSVILPDSFEVSCQPNALMRSVLGHILAAKSETDDVPFDALVRPCVKDPSVTIPDNIHIFYWLYPYERTIILRDFCMPSERKSLFQLRNSVGDFGFFNLLKFYPLAFLVTDNLSSYERLSSLHCFNEISPKETRNILINLNPIQPVTFPEECDDTNFIMAGRSLRDSVFSVVKPTKSKKKR
jgi:hypothetical protein